MNGQQSRRTDGWVDEWDDRVYEWMAEMIEAFESG